MLSDMVDGTARLVGINIAILRGWIGPDATDVVGAVAIAAVFLLAALAVALPISLMSSRLVDWRRLNGILRRMVAGDDGSVLTRQLNDKRRR